MAQKGHTVDNTMTQEEYERVLPFCASIADREKSIETFFYNLMLSTAGCVPELYATTARLVLSLTGLSVDSQFIDQ